MALAHGGDHAIGLLRLALAGVGAAPGGAVRLGGQKVLHLRPCALSAGLHLPDGFVGHLSLVAVFVHGRGGAFVVRLCLPANRVHRNFHLD